MRRESEVVRELRRALGERLATYRKLAGLSQAQLGRRLYTDRTALVRAEQGIRAKDARFWQQADDILHAEGGLVAAFGELAAMRAAEELHELQAERSRYLRQVASWQDKSMTHPAEPLGIERTAPGLDQLRRVVLGGWSEAAPGSPPVKIATVEAHRLYQMANYDAATRLLPSILARLTAHPSDRPTAAAAYIASAKLATKLGDAGLAWVTADRALRAAVDSGHSGLIGLAHYQVACALLRAGHTADAEQIAGTAAESAAATGVRRRTPEIRSVHGALLLLLAIIAARTGGTTAARDYLDKARELAAKLGQDGNWLWTAFGPTNVAIHELAVCTGLGDARQALELGAILDTDRLPPVLQGRRSQVHLELAIAAASQKEDNLAVLHLLEAERVAEQSVSRNAAAQSLLGTLLGRERKHATPGLRALSVRAGVVT